MQNLRQQQRVDSPPMIRNLDEYLDLQVQAHTYKYMSLLKKGLPCEQVHHTSSLLAS